MLNAIKARARTTGQRTIRCNLYHEIGEEHPGQVAGVPGLGHYLNVARFAFALRANSEMFSAVISCITLGQCQVKNFFGDGQLC
jgi:hypothetical protein